MRCLAKSTLTRTGRGDPARANGCVKPNPPASVDSLVIETGVAGAMPVGNAATAVRSGHATPCTKIVTYEQSRERSFGRFLNGRYAKFHQSAVDAL